MEILKMNPKKATNAAILSAVEVTTPEERPPEWEAWAKKFLQDGDTEHSLEESAILASSNEAEKHRESGDQEKMLSCNVMIHAAKSVGSQFKAARAYYASTVMMESLDFESGLQMLEDRELLAVYSDWLLGLGEIEMGEQVVMFLKGQDFSLKALHRSLVSADRFFEERVGG